MRSIIGNYNVIHMPIPRELTLDGFHSDWNTQLSRTKLSSGRSIRRDKLPTRDGQRSFPQTVRRGREVSVCCAPAPQANPSGMRISFLPYNTIHETAALQTPAGMRSITP